MSINLAIQFGMPTGAVSNFVQYARIDNTTTPVFTTVVPNPVTSPAVIATNIPDGQYQIKSTPVYPDGRTCQPTITNTPACPGLISISAIIQSGVLVVNYLAPSSVTSVFITVNYPNGGTFSQIYTNNGNPISIGLPAGVYGNYSISGQSVCDASSGFYSAPSASVVVNYNQAISGSYYLANTANGTCATAVTTLYTNGSPVVGSVLYRDSALTIQVTGYLFVQYAGIIYNLNSTNGTLGNNTGVTCSGIINVFNDLPSVGNVTNIGGITITGFAPPYPVTPGNTSTGNHGVYTGIISVSFTSVPSTCNVTLTVNGVLQQCINVSGTNTVNFGALSYQASDRIDIAIATGAC